jgi:hypothetical protein
VNTENFVVPAYLFDQPEQLLAPTATLSITVYTELFGILYRTSRCIMPSILKSTGLMLETIRECWNVLGAQNT